MKTMKIFTLIALVLVSVSCSKDKTASQVGQFTNTYTYSDVVRGFLDSPTTLPIRTVPIDSTITNQSYLGYGRYITNIELQNAQSSLTLTGVPAGTTLKAFTITINGEKLQLGDISSDQDLSTNSVLTFLAKNMSSLAAAKNMMVTVTFTPTTDVTTAILKLNYGSIYHYSK